MLQLIRVSFLAAISIGLSSSALADWQKPSWLADSGSVKAPKGVRNGCIVTFLSDQDVAEYGSREQPCNGEKGKGYCELVDIDWSICACGETKNRGYIPSFPVAERDSEILHNPATTAKDYLCTCDSAVDPALKRHAEEVKGGIPNPCVYWDNMNKPDWAKNNPPPAQPQE